MNHSSDEAEKMKDDPPQAEEPAQPEQPGDSISSSTTPGINDKVQAALESAIPSDDSTGQTASGKNISKEEASEFGPENPSAKVLKHPTARLPNCKITGTDYEYSLATALANDFQPHEIRRVKFDNKTEGVNWAFNEGSKVISCKPTQAGEFGVELCIDVHRYERHVYPLRLTVNPDPKTLWKNIPSTQDGIYPKPDSNIAYAACGDLSVVAASQRGRSHAQEGKPRDDDFAYHYDSNLTCAVLVVADGAGSAKFSREGSHLAATTACKHVVQETGIEYWGMMEPHIRKWKENQNPVAERTIQKSLYSVLIQGAFEAKKRIIQEAKDHEARYKASYNKTEKFTARDYDTTLILTVVKKFEFGWFVATYWVGDGGIGIYQPDKKKVIVQGVPDSGEYGGQTSFLTLDSVWPNDANELIKRRIRFDVVDSFKAIVLMTDGVTDPKFETEDNLCSVSHWDALWADLEKVVPWEKRDTSVADSLLAWMDFWSPGNHDDRTMMVLY